MKISNNNVIVQIPKMNILLFLSIKFEKIVSNRYIFNN
jgi:hypothetical protein